MGDEIGGDKVAGDKVAGDKLTIYGNVFVQPITLRTELRHQFTPLIQEYTRLFAGREEALEAIASWLRDSGGGYLAITAPAGFGKTALMAALIQTEPAAFAFHFFHATRVPHSLEQTSFLRNVVEQMSQWHGREKEGLPERLDQLVALYNQLMVQELPFTRILILDGIDEVTGWAMRNFLPPRLPPKLHVIVTLRDVDPDWMTAYGFPDDQTTPLPLGGLDREEVIQVLRAAGGRAAVLVENEAQLEQFMRVAAYPKQSGLGADPFCVRLLAEDINSGLLQPDQLSDQSRGLNLYLDGWWKQVKEMAGDEAAKDLFGTLTVALGAIGRRDLEAINPTLVDEWADDKFEDVIARVRRFVAGDAARGYTLAHPRLQGYMRWRLRPGLPKYKQLMLDYCAGWAEQDPPSAYCLAYYAQHLAEAGETEALLGLLSKEWMAAKFDCFQSQRSFAADVKIIAECAASGGAAHLPDLVRACLISNELSTPAPPEILAVLAQTGQGRRAMDYAALMPDAAEQALAYRLIGLALEERGESEAAQAAFAAAGGAGAGDKLEGPERTAVTSTLRTYVRHDETAEEDFAEFMESLAGAIDWSYPLGAAALLQDAGQIMARVGWHGRFPEIAALASDEAVQAWVLVHLAVGLARAGESEAAAEAAEAALAIDEKRDPDESHWLSTPMLTAAAQALALAGKNEEAVKVANRVLTTTRAAGFEMEKCATLIAFAQALLAHDRRLEAAEVALQATIASGRILDPWDQADIYEELLPLLRDLQEQEAAEVVAVFLLTLSSLLGEERLTTNLVTVAQVYNMAFPPAKTAGLLREYAEYEPLMHGAEIAEILAQVAIRLARLGESDLTVALGSELLKLWPHDAGEVLAEMAAALARLDHQEGAADLVANTVNELAQVGEEQEEEAVNLLESLAQGLARSGLQALARQAAGAIPWPGVREDVLAEIAGFEPALIPEDEVGEEGVPEKKTATRKRPLTAAQTANFITRFNERLLAGGLPARTEIYLSLTAAADDLAAIDGGQTVWRLFIAIRTVEGWWTR